MNYCIYCSAETEGNETVCRQHRQQLCDWVDEHPSVAPSAHGLSDGPGTQQVHFNRPDPLKEITRTARRSEDRMDAKTKKVMADKIAHLKSQEPFREKKDYGKDGHPAFEGMSQ